MHVKAFPEMHRFLELVLYFKFFVVALEMKIWNKQILPIQSIVLEEAVEKKKSVPDISL